MKVSKVRLIGRAIGRRKCSIAVTWHGIEVELVNTIMFLHPNTLNEWQLIL